jgi:hypothetical protein
VSWVSGFVHERRRPAVLVNQHFLIGKSLFWISSRGAFLDLALRDLEYTGFVDNHLSTLRHVDNAIIRYYNEH